MSNKALDATEIESRLSKLDGWNLKNGKLHRDFEFQDFNQAFGVISQTALKAESMNHHPEWFNVYNKLSVDLTTHDAGGISEKDFEMAEAINTYAQKRGS